MSDHLKADSTSPHLLIESILPKAGLLRETVAILLGSWIVAACAQIELPMWPVPITAQTFGVVVVGAMLGSKRGGLAMVAYLLQGSLGLPVFAGGSFGIAKLLGPTGGYLLGFIAAAWIVGFLVERGWGSSLPKLSAAMTVGTLLIFLCGLSVLAFYVPTEGLLAAGLIPFLPGAAIKIAAGALTVRGATRLSTDRRD